MWPLRTVGILYLLSGLWCAFQYQLAAGFIGYTLDEPAGTVEFISVYGGIQIGIALAALYFSYKPELANVATLFALFISVGLLAFRVVSMGLFGFNAALLGMAVIELLIVGLLIFQLTRLQRKPRQG